MSLHPKTSGRPTNKTEGKSTPAQITVKKTMDPSQDQIKKLTMENRELKSKLKLLESNSNEYLRQEFNSIFYRLTEENKELKTQLEREKVKVEEMQQRIEEFQQISTSKTTVEKSSFVAGEMSLEGHPNTANVNNTNNESINIAEQFSKLFDNEWKKALKELMQKKDEETSIKTLLFHFEKTFKMCQKSCSDLLEKMTASLPRMNIKEDEMTEEVSKVLNDIRKSMSVLIMGQIKKALKEKMRTSNMTIHIHLRNYLEACLEVCMNMSTQDPPMIIDATTPSGQFDSDKYRPYTKTGQTYKYLVWPVVYLHQNGPLLVQGVAQGI